MQKNHEKIRILVAEGNNGPATGLEHSLTALGYKVCARASSAAQAPDLVAEFQPELVLVDSAPDSETGWPETAELLKNQWGPPVVYLVSAEEARRLPPTDRPQHFEYVTKPFTGRDLKATLEAALYSADMERTRQEMAQSLLESEERFKLLFDGGPLPYQSLDDAGKVIAVNKAWLDTLGYTWDEVIGKHFSEFLHEDWKEHFQSTFPRFKEAGEIANVEFEMVRKDGATLLVSFNGKAGRNVEGIFQQTHCIFQDITERKRIEEEIKIFRAISDQAAHGKFIADLEGKLIYVNDFFAQYLGYTPAELIGKNLSTLYSERSWKDVLRLHETLLQNGSYGSVEVWHAHKNGQEHPMLMSGIVLPDETGRPQYLAASAIDITERKMVEEALRESEEKYRSMMESLSDPVYICSADYRVEYMNRAMVQRTGYNATGEYCYQAIHGLNTKCPNCSRDRVFEGEPFESEVFSAKDSRYYSVIHSPVFKANGTVSKLTIFRDITDRRRGEDERKKLESQLLQSQKMEALGTLAGGIAHDFNNILAAMTGYTELAMYELAEESEEKLFLVEVLKAGLRAKGLVRQILSFSRPTDENRKPMEIQPIIKESLKFLRASIPAYIELVHDIRPEPVVVFADPTQLNQIIINLCTNAAQAIGDQAGSIRVSLDLRVNGEDEAENLVDLKPGQYLRLCVQDTGSGMDRETMERIFDPFFTTKKREEGTGLGLSVIHGIVTSMGGEIKIQSEIGQGSTFEIFLPVLDHQSEAEISQTEPLERGVEKILVVDDEKILCELIQSFLTKLGYQVEFQTSPVDALVLLKESPKRFDLVITDHNMPHMTGAKLGEEMLKINPKLPVILCTGFSEHIDQEKAQAIGFRGLLMKPVTFRDLAKVVRQVLEPV